MSLVHKFLVFLMSAGIASGSVNIETWNANVSTWQITSLLGGASYGTLDWVSSLGGRSGVLRDTGGGATTLPREDLIFTPSGPLAGGVNYSTGGLGVLFDFYAGNYLPQKLDVYILGSGYQWFLNVTPDISLGWTSVYAPLTFGEGWYNPLDRTVSQFSMDLESVSRIGVRIWYADDQGGQIYGLDNFDVIPEPETWAFLGIAFLSIGYSFREKIDKSMAALMVRVRGG